MRAFRCRPFIAGWLAAIAMHSGAQAQQPAPQALEALEAAETPNVVRQDDERVIATEKRVRGGIVTEITVNSGGSTYYLKPNSPIGTSLPGSADNSTLRGAQWGVLQFDFGGARDARSPGAMPAPLPPPAAR